MKKQKLMPKILLQLGLQTKEKLPLFGIKIQETQFTMRLFGKTKELLPFVKI